MRPTFRAFVLFAAGIPLSFVFILIDETLWPLGLGYLAFIMTVVGIDAIRTPPFRALTFTTDIPQTLYIGETGSLNATLSSNRDYPPIGVETVCDAGPNLKPPPRLNGILRAGERIDFDLPLVPRRRGLAELHRIWLRWYGPMQLIERVHIESLDRTIPVVPNIRAVQSAALKFSAWDAFFGVKVQRQQGDGTEFDALREYMAGLDHRSIDWKHSARHHKLVCKEFRTERNHQIVLAFDTGHLMSGTLAGIPKLDHAINAALLLGYTSLRVGDRVGVFGFDSEVRLRAEPFGGIQGFPRLQRLTSEIEYRQDETNFTLGLVELLGRLKRRSLIVLQTDFVDTITAELMVENVQRLAARHVVIFVTMRDPELHTAVDARPASIRDVNRSVIADSFVRDRLVVFERLRRLGVHCVDAPSNRIGADLLNRYMTIKRQELI
ncbi:MAG: DUF58 domain-containing protein [Alphaproteobacteria bacterium]|nr:DUF58 domain-containing protein [Alphaproteobacteria bacterium]